MRAVDTNVLVRLLTPDDPGQTAAAESFIQIGAWVPLTALVETIWVLKSVYRLDSSELADSVEKLLQHETLVLQDEETVAAALDLFRLKPTLVFSDCLILQTARKAGHLPLGTFDRTLAKVDGAQRP